MGLGPIIFTAAATISTRVAVRDVPPVEKDTFLHGLHKIAYRGLCGTVQQPKRPVPAGFGADDRELAYFTAEAQQTTNCCISFSTPHRACFTASGIFEPKDGGIPVGYGYG